MEWEKALQEIRPLSEQWLQKARERLDDLTKPRGSLGMLEDIAAKYVGIRQESPIQSPKKGIFVFVGDHEVVQEGVSAYPQEVTALMVRNFLAGGAGVNVLARCAGAEVTVIDIGMKEELKDAEGLVKKNVRRSAGNIARGQAMTLEEAREAISVGFEMAKEAHRRGLTLIGTGDMGIGNTTPSSAIFSCLLPAEVEEVTGKGTGLNAAAIRHKVEIIKKAIEVNSDNMNDPLSILASVGGLEIAGICGLCIGGAYYRIGVVVDGFISSAGALVAMRMHPLIKDYLFFSHCSSEKGHRVMFIKEGIKPMLDLDLRLGEGTGAAIGMQIIEDAIRIYNDMATFSQVGITPGA